VNPEVEIWIANRLQPGKVHDGLMRIVQIKGTAANSKWARILLLFMDFRGLRLQTDLSLPCGNQWLWEFQVGPEHEPFHVKGMVISRINTAYPDMKHEYEVRFIMDEQHPLIVRMKDGYSGQGTEPGAQGGLRLDLFG
jgi:hypothetical protein